MFLYGEWGSYYRAYHVSCICFCLYWAFSTHALVYKMHSGQTQSPQVRCVEYL